MTHDATRLVHFIGETSYAGLVEQAHRAGTMAVRLKESGLPFRELVARWLNPELPQDVRDAFNRGVLGE